MTGKGSNRPIIVLYRDLNDDRDSFDYPDNRDYRKTATNSKLEQKFQRLEKAKIDRSLSEFTRVSRLFSGLSDFLLACVSLKRIISNAGVPKLYFGDLDPK